MHVEKDITFLVGYPRSGTTFLQKSLYNLLNCSIANEMDFIRKGRRLFKKFAVIKTDQQLNDFIDRLLDLRFFRSYEAIYSKRLNKHVAITRKKILGSLTEPSVYGVLHSIFSLIADNCNRSTVLCKDPALVNHLPFLNKMFPKSKVVHIIRDGRDCALSMKGVRWGDGNVYSTAVHWRRSILTSRADAPQLHQRYYELKYENLLSSPEEEWLSLQHFLTNSHNYRAARIFALDRERDPLKNNTRKWKTGLTTREVETFESIAGDLLKKLAYEVSSECKPLSPITRASYTIIDRIIRQYKLHLSSLPF